MSPAKVLIVEDSAPGARLWAELVSLAGGVAEIAASGAEGLAAVEAGPPVLVVMDLNLPDGDGAAWARRFKTAAGFGNVPIWACSGLDAAALLETAWEDQPFDGFIPKPFAAGDVLAKLRALLA